MSELGKFCKVSFCFRCMNSKEPQPGFRMPIYNKVKNNYEFIIVNEKNLFPSGFTPHVFIMLEIKMGIVSYSSVCCCCSLNLKPALIKNMRKKSYIMNPDDIKRLKKEGKMSVEKWEIMARGSLKL